MSPKVSQNSYSSFEPSLVALECTCVLPPVLLAPVETTYKCSFVLGRGRHEAPGHEPNFIGPGAGEGLLPHAGASRNTVANLCATRDLPPDPETLFTTNDVGSGSLVFL